MSDIHQEWRELREKNGNFINHLDGEMAKIKKEKKLLDEQNEQNLAYAGAFAMRFVAPPPFNCCQDDRDILKALNKAQADRIETLEKELIARKEQGQIDLAIKKDLDEKLDKATADYRALWVENENLKSQLASEKAQHEEKIDNAGKSYARLAIERNNLAKTISRMEKTIRDLEERNKTLRERLDATKKELADFIAMYDKAAADAHQSKVAKDRMGYSNSHMQSKIAKQANEIKRLTEENERLSGKNSELSGRYEAQKTNIACAMEMWRKYQKETETLKQALDIAAKDADANFERGKVKGMVEIWDELKDVYAGRSIGENERIFGYCTLGDIIMNLSPTWFISKAEEQAKDIQVGDEVKIFDTSCPDDDPHFDIGIVVGVYPKSKSFEVIGPNFKGCFDDIDIQRGNVEKTGQHFDSIPLDYFK